MKIKNITSTELFKLKLAVVTFHNGEQNAYLRESIAGDACYSSNNSLEFKENQMSDQRAKIASLTPCEGQEVVDKKKLSRSRQRRHIFQRGNLTSR